MMLNDIVKNLLKEVSGIAEIPANAAFNIRNNSKSEGDIPQKILILSPRRAAPVWIFM